MPISEAKPLSQNEKTEYKKYIDACFSTLAALSEKSEQFKPVYSKLRTLYETSILGSEEPDYIQILESIRQHCGSLGFPIQTDRSIVGSGNGPKYNVQLTSNSGGQLTYSPIGEEKTAPYLKTAKTPALYPIYIRRIQGEQFFYIFDDLAHAQEVKRTQKGWSAFPILHCSENQKYTILVPSYSNPQLYQYLSQFEEALKPNVLPSSKQVERMTALATANSDYFVHALLMFNDGIPILLHQAMIDPIKKQALLKLIIEKCSADALYALFYRLRCVPANGNINDSLVPLLDLIKSPLDTNLTTQLIKKLPPKQIEHLFIFDKRIDNLPPDFESLVVHASKDHFELLIDLFSVDFLETALMQNNKNGTGGMELCIPSQKASMNKIIHKISPKCINQFLTKKLNPVFLNGLQLTNMNGLNLLMHALDVKDFMLIVSKASVEGIHLALAQESSEGCSGFQWALLLLDSQLLFVLLERADRSLVKTLLANLSKKVTSNKLAPNIAALNKLLASEQFLEKPLVQPIKNSNTLETKGAPATSQEALIDDLPDGDAALFFNQHIYLNGEFTNAPQVQSIYQFVLNQKIAGNSSVGHIKKGEHDHLLIHPTKKVFYAHFDTIKTASNANFAINLSDALLRIQLRCAAENFTPDEIRFSQIIHVNANHWIALGVELLNLHPNNNISSNLKNKYQDINLIVMDSLSTPTPATCAAWLYDINSIFLFNPTIQTFAFKATTVTPQVSCTCGFHAAINAASFGLTGKHASIEANPHAQKQYFSTIMDGINRKNLSLRLHLDLTNEDPTTFGLRMAELYAAGQALSNAEKFAYKQYILERLEAIRAYTEEHQGLDTVYLQLQDLYKKRIQLISHPDYRKFLTMMKTRCEETGILVPIETKQSIVGAGLAQHLPKEQKKEASTPWVPLTESDLFGVELSKEVGYRPMYFKMKGEDLLEVYFLSQIDAQSALAQPKFKNDKNTQKTIYYNGQTKKYKFELSLDLSTNFLPLVDSLRISNQFQTIAALMRKQSPICMAELCLLQSDVDGNEGLLIKALRFPQEALPLFKLIVETCSPSDLYSILYRALNKETHANEVSILTVLLCIAAEPKYSAYVEIVSELIAKIPADNLHNLIKLQARNPDEHPDFHLIARFARQDHFDQLFDKLSDKFLEKALMVKDPEGVTAYSICDTHKNALGKLIKKVGLPVPFPTDKASKPVFIGAGLPTPSLSSPKGEKKEELFPWVALTDAEFQALVVPANHPYAPMYLKVKEPGIVEVYFETQVDAKCALQQSFFKDKVANIIFYNTQSKKFKIEVNLDLDSLLFIVDVLRKANQFKTIAARFKYQSSMQIFHSALLLSQEDEHKWLLCKALHNPEEAYPLLQVMVERLNAIDLYALLQRPLKPYVTDNLVSLMTVLICLAAEPQHVAYVKIVSQIISKIPAKDLPGLFTLKARNASESPDFHIIARHARLDHFEQLINKLPPEFLKAALLEVDAEGIPGQSMCEMHKSAYSLKLFSITGIKAPDASQASEAKDLVNKEVEAFINEQNLRLTFQFMRQKYTSDSGCCPQGKPIELWESKECTNWFKGIKNRPKTGLNKTLYYHYPEIYAVLMRATKIHFGYVPRDIQLAALAVFINAKGKRLLEQVSTGEGKSLIVAMLAVVKILEEDVVDIVTSSPVLAARDAEETRGFYAIFGIKVDHNWDEKDGKQYTKGYKACYDADVVYGAALPFQWDFLRHGYMQDGTRGTRPYQTIIIDEVDSSSVDGFATGGEISKMQPAMEHLVLLLEAIWQELIRIEQYMSEEKLDAGAADKKPLVEKILKDYVLELLNGNNKVVYVPKHLRAFALEQVDNWVQSALTARYGFSEGKEYLITRNKEEDIDVITFVDLPTGVLHNNMMYKKGLFQFLQIKHRIPLRPESLSAAFNSNLGFFSMYSGGFYGMTGTLGTEPTQDLLRSLYKVDLVRVPTFKAKRFKEYPAQLAENNTFWLDAILFSTLNEVENKRAVLIICETINEVESIEARFIKHYGKKPAYISRYTRSALLRG